MERLPVTLRRARQSDKADMLDLTRNIWDGDDYVPHAWEGWLVDSQGLLVVAEHEGRVLGLAHLARLSSEDWWMEGMRVHPEFEGRGIASQLHEYLTSYWLRHGSGTVRLTTASFRQEVHHLCQKQGFQKMLEISFFIAPALDEPLPEAVFTGLTGADLVTALEFIRQSPSLMFSAGMLELGWRMAPPREVYLADTIQAGRAWWWRGREGLLSTWDDEDEEGPPIPYIQCIACSPNQLAECLLDFRRLAGSLERKQAGWMAPLHPELLPILSQTGFKRDWDEAMFLYVKRHPTANVE
ncbi:MAG: GNAT family N-acetyltransferase [Anaerolineales bacterium]|nr:GNAT family N-acetyltransferase [Anaerolineales bacterium]